MKNVAVNDITTREITAMDAGAAATLCAELGYSVSADVMEQRIRSLAEVNDQAIYVACLSGEVVGWIEVGEARHLAAEPRAEIGGLVVAGEVRGGGIGSRLLARAEEWALERGLNVALVRSRVTREAAHRFYLREGYARVKTSAVFTKTLG